ncbi:MAG: phage major tail tube protein [Synergistaceae bacterium]|nr:phage major tail tube protein [Synergistaceae bacterium]
MSNIIPEKGINYRCYLNGGEFLGSVSEGTFPNFEAMTSEVRGAGLAGVVDSPTVGHLNSMTMSLTWRTVTSAYITLMIPRAHDVDLYASMQQFDAGLGIYRTVPIHVFVKAIPKNITPGNLVVSDVMGTQDEFEITYIKIELDGREVVEVDKYNYVFKIRGVDYLASVRADLGMQA